MTMQGIGTVLFALALIHTFSTKYFEHLARLRPRHAGLWHLLAEVEIVFGFWAMVLVVAMFALQGKPAALEYLDGRNFTEPLFVFAIMVVAGSRPVLQFGHALVNLFVRLLPSGLVPRPVGFYLVTLTLVPLLGSFITEPAAMTLSALILVRGYFSANVSSRLKYATLAVLFVNVSIGGTLTAYAAPPILMVATKWGWDTSFMLGAFGWKAALVVSVNAICAVMLNQAELRHLQAELESPYPAVPIPLIVGHLLLLAGIVVFAHEPPVFIGLFLLFMGIASAYPRYQNALMLREGLLVAFFLGGLIVLGGLQQWWLEPLLIDMSERMVFWGAAGLTAVTDNAALTYLGSQVEGLSPEFKYALATGAVTGGGLTVIANAPNPAGLAILRPFFDESSVSALRLFGYALLPTFVAALAFRFL